MSKSIFALIALSAVLLTIGSCPVQAQTGSGTISGHITDSSKGILEGAQVAAQPGGYTASADQTGQFRLNLPSGKYQLTISHVGFNPFPKLFIPITSLNTSHSNGCMKA